MIGRVIRKEQFKVLDRRGINIYDSPNINGYGGLVSYFAIGIDTDQNDDSAKCICSLVVQSKTILRIAVSSVCGNVGSSYLVQ